MNHRLSIPSAVLAQVCARHRIRRLSLFGSVLKGTERPDSDLDLLVEFEPGAKPTLLDMARIEEDLSSLVGGRRPRPEPLLPRGSPARGEGSVCRRPMRVRHMIDAGEAAARFQVRDPSHLESEAS